MIKVVIVEDEKLLRRELSLTTPWEELGCELLGEAENGLEGLQLIKRIRPHIIITDIRMPGLDGLTMIKKAQSNNYHPQALLLTGYSDFEYAREALRLGVIDYILKPVDDAQLYILLKQIAQKVRDYIVHNEAAGNFDILKESSHSAFNEYFKPHGSNITDNYVQQAVDFIHANYQSDIALQDTSEHLKISPGYLSHLFKNYTGYTFLRYLTLFRLRQSMLFLKEQHLQISEVAYKSGFQNPGYFIQLFRRHTGVTPGQYRKGLPLPAKADE
ncbi:MAG: response regulator [Spirochaetales bacterium]|nr:response regulator [Spirochaetales bacterium]